MKIITKQINNNGFTLIELLVVVAIISIISAITIGSLQEARVRAEDARIIRQVTEFQNAVALFVTSEGRYPIPVVSNPTDVTCIKAPGSECVWFNSTYTAPNLSGGDFAFWESLEGEIPEIKTPALYANTISDYINIDSITLPIIEVRGDNYGGGILYQCNNTDCSSANVFFATNNVVEKGQKLGIGNDYTLYKQDAADPGQGYGGY